MMLAIFSYAMLKSSDGMIKSIRRIGGREDDDC